MVTFKPGGAATTFFGICEERPEFALAAADYPNAQTFTVSIDGREWALPLEAGVEGAGLLLEGEAVTALKGASEISFKVGDKWTYAIKLHPFVSRMINECDAIRRR